ncbi:MAG: Ku protein [Xanthobacteraceae bacterium]
MAPRANWKGHLKLSLVACAVALFPATSTEQKVRFNILSRQSGHRVRYEVVDAETGDPVPEDERVKGYKLEDNTFVYVEEDEFSEVALESTHTIDIESFVPRAEVDAVYLDTPYFLVPEDPVSQEAFAVIREAMRKQDVVGLARVVLHRRERIVMLEPRGKGLLATTLHYRNEVRKEYAYFEDIPDVEIGKEMVDLAVHIVGTKAAHFDPVKFEDRYEQALVALIQAKRAGQTITPAPAATPSNVVNLMDALRRSVRSTEAEGASTAKGGGAESAASQSTKSPKAAKRPASSRTRPAASRGTASRRKRMKKAS